MVAEPVTNNLLPPLLMAIAESSLEWKRLTHNRVPGATCAAPIAEACAGGITSSAAAGPRQQTAAIFSRPFQAEGRRPRIEALPCTSEVSFAIWTNEMVARLP